MIGDQVPRDLPLIGLEPVGILHLFGVAVCPDLQPELWGVR